MTMTTRKQRADIIADLAAQGYSSRQMPAKVGVTEETVRQIARDFDIEIPADKVVGGTRRIDFTDVVRRIVLDLEATAESIFPIIDWNQVHAPSSEVLSEWVQVIRAAETEVRAFRCRLEAMLEGTTRHCPICDKPVTGKANRVYCGATCRQKARRARVLGVGTA